MDLLFPNIFDQTGASGGPRQTGGHDNKDEGREMRGFMWIHDDLEGQGGRP